jgi:hypothetical protein
MIGLYDISIVVSRRGIMPAFSHLRHGSRQASGTKQKQPVSLKKRVSVGSRPPCTQLSNSPIGCSKHSH